MTDKTSRRGFLERSGAAAAGLGMFQVLGRSTARAAVAPNSALKTPVLALIGCGGMGRHNMGVFMDHKVPVAAVCDVDASHAAAAAADVEKKQGKKPDIYKDFRELLDRKDIDTVIIATPDHWHALPMIRACEAGKSIYQEKPISHDIREALAMAAAARKHKTVVQVGTWQRSTREFVAALNHVRSKDFGPITVARAWKTDNNQLGHNEPKDPPAELDYDFWIGPAEFKPYTGKNCHNLWRWFWNTAAGMTGDWGVHMIDIALLGLCDDTNVPMPEQVACMGGKLAYPDDDRTTPDTQLAVMKFPHTLIQWETNRRPLDGEHDNGTQFIAADGKTLTVWRGGLWLKGPDGKPLDNPPDPEGMTGLPAHVQNLLDCIDSGAQPRSNIASMARTTIVCHLINAAYLAGRPVRWNADANDIDGHAGKNTQSYARDYRTPWELPNYA